MEIEIWRNFVSIQPPAVEELRRWTSTATLRGCAWSRCTVRGSGRCALAFEREERCAVTVRSEGQRFLHCRQELLRVTEEEDQCLTGVIFPMVVLENSIRF